MSTRLQDIPVRIENHAGHAVSAPVKALLLEVQDMLQALRDSGVCNAIDLRSLPMMPGDMQCLKDVLGGGEVQATLDALGPSVAMETGVPGVWWVTHKNAHDEILSEFIEVTMVPEILVTQPQDLQDSVAILQGRLAETEPP